MGDFSKSSLNETCLAFLIHIQNQASENQTWFCNYKIKSQKIKVDFAFTNPLQTAFLKHQNSIFIWIRFLYLLFSIDRYDFILPTRIIYFGSCSTEHCYHYGSFRLIREMQAKHPTKSEFIRQIVTDWAKKKHKHWKQCHFRPGHQ